MKRVVVLGTVCLAFASSCSTPGNARKEDEMKYDYVAGYSGDDKVVVKDDNASLHSDRDAVKEYTRTVDTINNQRQLVEGDLVGLNNCRKQAAAAKNVRLNDAPTKLDCMAEVVKRRERAGEDLVQVKDKLVLRKKDDFKSRLEEAQACLDQMVHVRDLARDSYNMEGCGGPAATPTPSDESM